MTAVALLVAGAAGALLRAAVEARLARDAAQVPWALFTVNVAGSALLGAVLALADAGRLPAATLSIVGTGFCGALTTFSGFSMATLRAAGDSRRRAAVIAAGMVVACGLAAAAGAVAAGVR